MPINTKIVLVINTGKKDNIELILKTADKEMREISPAVNRSSQVILPLLFSLCKKAAIKPSEITEINVFRGPGSFTGLRVGITVAKTLGWLLDIPVNGKKDYLFKPRYT